MLKILEALEKIQKCKAECQQMILQKAKKPEENFQERLAKKKKTTKVGLRVRPAMLVALKSLL